MKLEDVDGYESALAYAGATVHAYETFGSYQGDWWAKVSFEGKTGWVHDYYGSCSGCDAFEGEFGYRDRSHEAMMAFGKEYLENIMTQEEAEKEAGKHSDWDLEADEVVEFIKSNA